MFSVTIANFRTQKQALEFLNWYEGGGEQQFYDHLDICDMKPGDGCNVNVSRKGTHGCYDIKDKNIYAEVEQYEDD